MPAPFIVVACGGALGSAARYATVMASQFLLGGRFPFGTLLVNCLGSFFIGLFMSIYLSRFGDAEYGRLFIVVGFLGGYTTFSSFAWETWALYLDGQWLAATINILLTNVVTIVLLILGMQAGRLLGG